MSKWFDEHGNFMSEFPQQCVNDCSHQGSCDLDVEHWVKELNFEVPRDLAIRYLKEYGAWEDLNEASDETLAQRVLWLACGDIKENGEWFGLIH